MFNPNAAGNNAPVNNVKGNDESWKAQAFLNVYLPTADGTSRRKIGAIPLKASKNYEAALIKKLTEDPESLARMVNMLEIEFNLADQPVKDTDLPF